MGRRAEKVKFGGATGETLAARLDMPVNVTTPKAYAFFVHGFTLGKDSITASRIAQALASYDIATLRFDFTGIGDSGGDFSSTNFTTNIDDIHAAAAYLTKNCRAPTIAVGHSLGGAALLFAARMISSLRAIVTIGAPYDPYHVTHHFHAQKEEIKLNGEAIVNLGGRSLKIKRHFVESLKDISLEKPIAELHKALLVMHSPFDQTVGIENAEAIYKAAKHPKSFISLDSADHFLSAREDAVYVAEVLASWASRYVDSP